MHTAIQMFGNSTSFPPAVNSVKVGSRQPRGCSMMLQPFSGSVSQLVMVPLTQDQFGQSGRVEISTEGKMLAVLWDLVGVWSRGGPQQFGERLPNGIKWPV